MFSFDLLVTFDPSMPVNSGTIFVHSELDSEQVNDKIIWLRSKKGDNGRFIKKRNRTALLPGPPTVVLAPVDATSLHGVDRMGCT